MLGNHKLYSLASSNSLPPVSLRHHRILKIRLGLRTRIAQGKREGRSLAWIRRLEFWSERLSELAKREAAAYGMSARAHRAGSGVGRWHR